MKFKTTRKAIVNGSNDIIAAGYCELQYLLRNHDPIACTCGVYGWNFDVYEVYGKTICTGYRGMPGRSANNAKEYEKKAEAIWIWSLENRRSYEEKREDCENLLIEFLKQA